MGQNIDQTRFDHSDFEHFSRNLHEETALLQSWLCEGVIEDQGYRAGLEMEAWLTDQNNRPAPLNEVFLQQLNNPMVVPELARFNFEINGPVEAFDKDIFKQIHSHLSEIWSQCHQVAGDLQAKAIAIGILPSARLEDFSERNMSRLPRYQAMNQQIMRMRNSKPIHIDISGRDSLHCQLPNVMLESATTSFQMHLQMPPAKARRIYNASKIVSAPLLAVSANSPWLFGKNLWAETRIPVFEQAIQVGHKHLNDRVSFGIRYIDESIMEVFAGNISRFPILLPEVQSTAVNEMKHLQLHNGTIWRWNRPLIGFDEQHKPHLRLEQRCVPAGPTMRDAVANMAFYYGLLIALAEAEIEPESQLPYEHTERNFYQCAQYGLQAGIVWLDGRQYPVSQLIQEQLVKLALQGLKLLGVDSNAAAQWLDIIYDRAAKKQNGADWQSRWTELHGQDMSALVEAYSQRQQEDLPVHLWTLE